MVVNYSGDTLRSEKCIYGETYTIPQTDYDYYDDLSENN